MDITLIAAVSSNGVIGVDGRIPWDIPEDLEHFREQTIDHPVIMGRKTFDGIVTGTGGPLENRMNIVLSHDPQAVESRFETPTGVDALVETTAVHGASDPGEALALALTQQADQVFIGGGESVYREYLPVSDRLVITEVHETYEGDTLFPEWDETLWTETTRVDRGTHSFVEYRRAVPDSTP